MLKNRQFLKGFQLDSPRGPIEIDDRDIAKHLHQARRTAKRAAENIEFSSIPNVPATEPR